MYQTYISNVSGVIKDIKCIQEYRVHQVCINQMYRVYQEVLSISRDVLGVSISKGVLGVSNVY